MALRPLELDVKTSVIGMAVALTALVGFIIELEEIIKWLIPSGNWLNPRFVSVMVLCIASAVGVFFHELWRKEFTAHRRAQLDIENLERQLDISERKRMTDVITGVPNGSRLTADLEKFFSDRPVGTQANIVLIDIKGFRKINREHGFLKGDEILRKIAQKIYSSMRRNEYMYQHPALEHPDRPRWKRFYRRYPGGDEFVFILEGNQGAAIGFVVNRVFSDFKELSRELQKDLGDAFKLSFHCAIAPLLRNDSADDVLSRVEDCYMRAADGTEDFTICWSPVDFERSLPNESFQKKFYEKARENFQVMNVEQDN